MKKNKIGLLLLVYLLSTSLAYADFFSYGFPPPAPNRDWPAGNWIGGISFMDTGTLPADDNSNAQSQFIPEKGCEQLGDNYRIPSVIDIDRGKFQSPSSWDRDLTRSTTYNMTGPYFHSSAYKDKNIFGELLYDPLDYKVPNSNTRIVRKPGALGNEWGFFSRYNVDIPLGKIALSEVIFILADKNPPFLGDSRQILRAMVDVATGNISVDGFASTLAVRNDSTKYLVLCIKEIK